MPLFPRKFRFKKHIDSIILSAVILVSAFFYILSLNGVKFTGLFSGFISNSAYGIYRVVDYPVFLTEKVYRNYMDILQVKKKNRILKARLNVLELNLLKDKSYRAENEKLKSALSLKGSLKLKLIPASVSYHGLEGWFKSLYIDKGTRDGVAVGDGVISSGGVVGRVIETGDSGSRVVPITNPACVIPVIDADTGTMGIAQGIGGGLLKMRFVLNYKKIKKGDRILTSGLGGFFSAGLPVGRVYSVGKGGNGIFRKTLIIPRRDLFDTNYVFVEKQ